MSAFSVSFTHEILNKGHAVQFFLRRKQKSPCLLNVFYIFLGQWCSNTPSCPMEKPFGAWSIIHCFINENRNKLLTQPRLLPLSQLPQRRHGQPLRLLSSLLPVTIQQHCLIQLLKAFLRQNKTSTKKLPLHIRHLPALHEPPLAAASPPPPSTPTPNPNTSTSCERPWFFQSLHFWLGLIAGLSIGLLIVLLVVQGARTGALREQFNQMQALLQQQQTALATLSSSSTYFPPHTTTTPQQPTLLRTPSQSFAESPPFYGSPGPFLS